MQTSDEPPIDTDPWQGHIDPARLSTWMVAQGFSSAPITDVTRLAGGTQNLLYRFIKGGRPFVLRRPPVVPVATGERLHRHATHLLQRALLRIG